MKSQNVTNVDSIYQGKTLNELGQVDTIDRSYNSPMSRTTPPEIPTGPWPTLTRTTKSPESLVAMARAKGLTIV